MMELLSLNIRAHYRINGVLFCLSEPWPGKWRGSSLAADHVPTLELVRIEEMNTEDMPVCREAVPGFQL